MITADSLIVVHLVDKTEIGSRFERKRMSWPLHITLASWFEPPSESEVDKAMRQLAQRHRSFDASVGGIEYLGEQRNVPVNVIDGSLEHGLLRANIIDELQSLKVTFEPSKWIGTDFKPHITRHEPDGHFKVEGDVIHVSAFQLIRLDSKNICEVVKEYKLGYNT